ncbi:MAG: hypothetical protein KJ630_08130 [Proteobacteria bacterium]|nr:hypothetical protein [Pseudomonadota bacterium]
MRKAKIINIEGLGEVTVKEVSPLAIYRAMSAGNKIEELLSLAGDCITLSPEQLQNLYPSEIEQLVDAFMEVNSSFLAIAGKLALKETIVAMAQEVSQLLPPMFAGSYKMVMARLPGSMAGAAFSSPSQP